MLEREPSRTALSAAAYRAAHQVIERGAIFRDPLAVAILDLDAEALRAGRHGGDAQRGMRLFIAARSAIAERALADGVAQRGIRQLVVLGAGLDTFAYRNPFEDRLRVFEVDHPATQAWKRSRLSEARIAIGPSVTYAPVDFERDNLTEQLIAAGLDPTLPTFFSWLGVVPYLTGDAIAATLKQVAALPGGAEIAFDYGEPREQIAPEFHAQHDERAARVAMIGEPFLSAFDPPVLHALLTQLGFASIADYDGEATRALFSPQTASRTPVPRRGGHVLVARTRE